MKLWFNGYSVLENIMGEKNNQWWGWGLDKEISGSFPDYLSLMLGKPRIRLNNLKTSLRFPCLGLNPIIDSISHQLLDWQGLYFFLKWVVMRTMVYMIHDTKISDWQGPHKMLCKWTGIYGIFSTGITLSSWRSLIFGGTFYAAPTSSRFLFDIVYMLRWLSIIGTIYVPINFISIYCTNSV